MELLGLFANQAAIALDLLQRARAARTVLEEKAARRRRSPACAARLDEAEPEKREAALQLASTHSEKLLLRER